MSFRCQICKFPQATHAVPKRIVTKKRVREYSNRGNVYSKGWEVVEEKVACAPCATDAPEAVFIEEVRRAPAMPTAFAELAEMDFGDQGEDSRRRRVVSHGMGR